MQVGIIEKVNKKSGKGKITIYFFVNVSAKTVLFF